MVNYQRITGIGGILAMVIGFAIMGLYNNATHSLTVATWQGDEPLPVHFLVQKSIFRKAQIIISGIYHFYYHMNIQHECRPDRHYEFFVDLEILSANGIHVWNGTLHFESAYTSFRETAEASATVELPPGNYILLVAANNSFNSLDKGLINQMPNTQVFLSSIIIIVGGSVLSILFITRRF
ncbi:MAG: hypothetical protein ACE5R6_11500 [Candidatus Heimdallarchaeota archaeon]